jgi:hypothetical protein
MNINKHRLAATLCLLIILFGFSCREDLGSIDKPSDFTKEKREELGDRIQLAIAQQPELFPVLPNIPPFDTTVYWYTQTLYDQVTNALKSDNQSPQDNRWNEERPWRITVLDKEELNAFAIPGGHFYITTGFLRALETEHELYYVLAFEAMLMNDRTLLNRLISEHNTTQLSNIGKRIPNPDGTDAFTLANTIERLYFDDVEVIQADELAAQQICASSIFSRFGIVSLLNRLQNESDFTWLETRYYDIPSRRDFVQNAVQPTGNCGSFIQNGGYLRYVLTPLD